MMKAVDFFLAVLLIGSILLVSSLYKNSSVEGTVLVCGHQKAETTSAKIPFIQCFPISYRNLRATSPAHGICPPLASNSFLMGRLLGSYFFGIQGLLFLYLLYQEFERCPGCCLRLFTVIVSGFFVTATTAIQIGSLSSKLSPTFIESCQLERLSSILVISLSSSPYLIFSLMSYGLSVGWLLTIIQFIHYPNELIQIKCMIALFSTVCYFEFAFLACVELHVSALDIFFGSAIGGIMGWWMLVVKIMLNLIYRVIYPPPYQNLPLRRRPMRASG